MVPVVRHAEALDLWDCAAELVTARGSRENRNRDARGTVAAPPSRSPRWARWAAWRSTPVINYPEVAIIGVNKIMMRPVWDGSGFVPRKMMNLSSSFDHRVVDGWDAAVFVQRIKTLLETPAMIFVEG